MRSVFFSLIFLLIISCGSFREVGKKKDIALSSTSTDYISDLVLLYHGGTHRLDYTEEQLEPYVYTLRDGKKEFLFDGFLFIEFKDNLGKEYAKGYGQAPGDKQSWEWLLERNFEEGKGVSALNSLLSKLGKEGVVPMRTRKIVMTLPDPIIDFAEWGEIKGRRLDFSIKEDRIEACKWYIDLLDQQWKLQNYDQLDFEGFYWVAETQSTTAEILPEIAMYIKSKGYKFYWIPYMYAEGAAKWREAGFDVAYQQPNYFFDLDKPKSLFTEAIFNSKNYNMGLEMEFDERITEEAFLKRFYDYIEAFNGANAWTNTPIAYYEGGKAWLEMSKYPQGTDVKKAYDDLADIIIMRQKHEDTKL